MAFHLTLEFVFGVLANIISSMVCLAPLPTFYQICKKKTSEGFQSIPYVIALFSAMLWLFYALFDDNATLLITINSFTLFMQVGYLSVYLFYADRKDRMFTAKLILFFNVFGFGMIAIFTLFLTNGRKRVDVLGWICMIFALCVFVAPLGIMRKVIKTKSVEFMPISLSFFLTLSAVMWFFFGYLKKDIYVYIPNILGFFFGILQMILYVIYKKSLKTPVRDPKLQELSEHIVDVAKLSATICSELNTAVVASKLNVSNGHEVYEIQQVITKEETKNPKQEMEA
ncbi:bidirectional sugar transporter SWEET10-like [Mercurialis annua]|uniref:bidirectional sugar transporter SWEET10-like n=1 Tax=Mercurialis annua TaxID=3986 RepID=UPI002160B157|nr:bidirectional sugar transporter SWEET10-like [Mercurialis annua]